MEEKYQTTKIRNAGGGKWKINIKRQEKIKSGESTS